MENDFMITSDLSTGCELSIVMPCLNEAVDSILIYQHYLYAAVVSRMAMLSMTEISLFPAIRVSYMSMSSDYPLLLAFVIFAIIDFFDRFRKQKRIH